MNLSPATADISANMSAIADALMEEIVAFRRHLHQNPELSGHEKNTAAFIARHCREIGCEVREHMGGYGILAALPAKQLPAKSASTQTILLRADMDALPIQDGKRSVYSSTVSGVSHACGHDAHSAMLLGALLLLSRLNIELPYKVAAIFQPAEEIVEGAAAMLKDGILDELRPYRAYALHVCPQLPSGSIGIKSGAMCAAADMFEVEITGRGGHAARPHECIDVILIASQIIQALHHITSRNVDPMHPSVLTIGQISAGHAANVIPDKVLFSGTIRSLNNDDHDTIKARTDSVIRNTAEAWGAAASFRIHHSTPALINDAEAVAQARDALGVYAPEIAIIEVHEPSMGGEDFAEFLQRTPGCLLRLGTASGPATRHPLHHSCFDIDEAAMRSGILALASLCLPEK